MTDVTVASLNIRGIPLTGSRLTAHLQAIGAFFDASDVDVVCLREVATYGHLVRRMRSFRYVSFRRALPGPAGDVVTFSGLPVAWTGFDGFGPVDAPIPRLARLRARLKGALVIRLEQPAMTVVNTHPLANTDGDWSEGNRFMPAHRAQLGMLARAVVSSPGTCRITWTCACGCTSSALSAAWFRSRGTACPPVTTGQGGAGERGRCRNLLRNEYGRNLGMTVSTLNPTACRCSATATCVRASMWSAQSKYSRGQHRKFGPITATMPPGAVASRSLASAAPTASCVGRCSSTFDTKTPVK